MQTIGIALMGLVIIAAIVIAVTSIFFGDPRNALPALLMFLIGIFGMVAFMATTPRGLIAGAGGLLLCGFCCYVIEPQKRR